VAPTLEDAYLVAIKTGRLDGTQAVAVSWPGAKAVANNGDDFRPAVAERGDR
jgi:hypothetical protein